MHTSVALISTAAFIFSSICGIERIYPSGSLKAQNLHVPVHLFVKLIFLLITYVTLSPAAFFLSLSARENRKEGLS